jgi:hypothetical protein
MRYSIPLVALIVLSACGSQPDVSKDTQSLVTAFQETDSAGTAGLTIVSNQSINRFGPDVYLGTGTNLCPTYGTTDTCSFEGGQLVKYSDGSVYLSGRYRMIRDDAPNTNTSYQEGFNAQLIKPTSNTSDIVMTSKHYVSVNNPRVLFLHWERGTDLIQLVIDTNQNQQVDVSDTVLKTLTLN